MCFQSPARQGSMKEKFNKALVLCNEACPNSQTMASSLVCPWVLKDFLYPKHLSHAACSVAGTRVSSQFAQSNSSDGSALLAVPTPYVCLDKNNFTCVHERRWEEAANCVRCWGLTGFSYCEVTRPSQNAEERSGKQPLVSLNKLPCAATQAKEDTLNVLSQLFRLELLQKLSVNVDIKKTSTWQHTNCAHVHVGPWRAGRIQAAHWARRKCGAASLR